MLEQKNEELVVSAIINFLTCAQKKSSELPAIQKLGLFIKKCRVENRIEIIRTLQVLGRNSNTNLVLSIVNERLNDFNLRVRIAAIKAIVDIIEKSPMSSKQEIFDKLVSQLNSHSRIIWIFRKVDKIMETLFLPPFINILSYQRILLFAIGLVGQYTQTRRATEILYKFVCSKDKAINSRIAALGSLMILGSKRESENIFLSIINIIKNDPPLLRIFLLFGMDFNFTGKMDESLYYFNLDGYYKILSRIRVDFFEVDRFFVKLSIQSAQTQRPHPFILLCKSLPAKFIAERLRLVVNEGKNDDFLQTFPLIAIILTARRDLAILMEEFIKGSLESKNVNTKLLALEASKLLSQENVMELDNILMSINMLVGDEKREIQEKAFEALLILNNTKNSD